MTTPQNPIPRKDAEVTPICTKLNEEHPMIDLHGEHLDDDSDRAIEARETQRDIDARKASWYSTQSEPSFDRWRELYRHAR